jgi:hypothetical protein
MIAVKEAVLVCAQDKKTRDVMGWLERIDSERATVDTFRYSGEAFVTLDRKLRQALSDTLYGELQRSIRIKKDEVIRKKRAMNGRQLLHLIYRHLATSRSNQALDGVVSLLAGAKWFGDKHKESFRNVWQRKVQTVGGRFPPWVLADALYGCLQSSSDLKFDMMQYAKDHLGALNPRNGAERYEALVKILDGRIGRESARWITGKEALKPNGGDKRT